MRGRVIGLVLVLVMLVVLAIAGPAMAANVTKIMYAQENVRYYEYTPASSGKLTITLSWTRADGTGTPVYPEAEIDGCVQTGSASDPYVDQDVKNLYLGTNPQTATMTVSAGQTYYIGVMPYVGDVPYHLVCKLGAATVIDQTGWAYASDGEVFVPSNGTWVSQIVYWPGTTGNVYACWNDYAYERVAGSTYATMAEAYSNVFVAPQDKVVTTIPGTGNHAATSNTWYTLSPEIWPAAANPNTWPSGATVPKPGDLAATAAPAWYVYSYPDSSVATDTAAYSFGSLTNASASKRNYSSEASTSSTITYKFYGTSIRWYYTTNSAAGIAKVTIDGTVVGTVDQYSSSVQYKQYTDFTGLSNSSHTIVVQSNKTKNTKSSSMFLTHDAFGATTDAADPTPLSENNYDGSTTMRWGQLTSASASGGSYCSTASVSAALAFVFNGTSITWKYTKNSAAGVARVYIDGVDKGTVDLYSSSVSYQQTVTFSGLSSGYHTILIVNNKTKNSASSSMFLTHDAFIVGSTTYEN